MLLAASPVASHLIPPQSWKAGTFVIAPVLQTGKLRCSFRADALAEALRVPHSPTPSPQDTACLGQAGLRPQPSSHFPIPAPGTLITLRRPSLPCCSRPLEV